MKKTAFMVFMAISFCFSQPSESDYEPQEESVQEESVQEESVQEESVQEESAQEESAQEESAQEEPVQEEPVQEEPSQEAPVRKAYIRKAPAPGTPARKTYIRKTPVPAASVPAASAPEEPDSEEPDPEAAAPEEPAETDPNTSQPTDGGKFKSKSYQLSKPLNVLGSITPETTIKSLSLELSYKNFSGLGLGFHFEKIEAYGADLALGWGLDGITIGARGRVYLAEVHKDFFAGAGVSASLGSFGLGIPVQDIETGEWISLAGASTIRANAVVGVRIIHEETFYILPTIGYSVLISPSNPWKTVDKDITPSTEAEAHFDGVFGTGPVAGINVGILLK